MDQDSDPKCWCLNRQYWSLKPEVVMVTVNVHFWSNLHKDDKYAVIKPVTTHRDYLHWFFDHKLSCVTQCSLGKCWIQKGKPSWGCVLVEMWNTAEFFWWVSMASKRVFHGFSMCEWTIRNFAYHHLCWRILNQPSTWMCIIFCGITIFVEEF
jgi:hypothetical protein